MPTVPIEVWSGAVLIGASASGVVLCLLGMPGLWLMALSALGCKLWTPDLLSWWVVGVAAGLAITSDIADLFAGAYGARKTGGAKRASVGAMIGGFAGAILATPILPIIGTILGGMAGAALGAAIAQRTMPGATVKQSAKVAGGAAAGWLAAVVVKVTLAIVSACVLAAAVIIG